MIQIHLYGKLRKLAEKSKATEDSILTIKWEENMTVMSLLCSLKLTPKDVGEIFVNYKVITDYSQSIEKDSRVALFSAGMHLLCGGQHLKGHGFIQQAHESLTYWNDPFKQKREKNEKDAIKEC